MTELPKIIEVTENNTTIIKSPYPDADCQWCGDTGRFLDIDDNEWPCVEGCTGEKKKMKDALLSLIDEEVKFAKGTGMPQFVMGLLQARRLIVDYKPMQEAQLNESDV